MREPPRSSLRVSVAPVCFGRWLAALLSLVVGLGCGSVPQRPGLMANFAEDEVSVTQLRAIDYEFASRFGQLVAKCANEVLEVDDDPEMRRRALMWQMYASPQARAAAFNQDPMAGLLELWGLAGQQQRYFSVGDGHGLFDESYPCVDETVDQLYAEAEHLAAETITEDEFPAIQERVETWIDQHPIEGELFVRPTAQAGLAALVGRDIEGGLKAVGNIEETMRDLNDRLAILSVQLPTESRWQAEYLVRELFEEPLAGAASSVTGALERVAAFSEGFERSLHEQTTRMLDGFTYERESLVAALEAERVRIFEALDQERASLFDSVGDEVDETLDRFEEVGLGLIDHFFERLIGLLIGMGIFLLLLVAILILALRPRGDSTQARDSQASPPEEPPPAEN